MDRTTGLKRKQLYFTGLTTFLVVKVRMHVHDVDHIMGMC